MDRIKIGDREIGKGCPVFIIAEAGVNHNGSLDMALQMVDEAAKSGVDCIKFQTFEADNIETKHSLKPAYFTGRDSGLDKIAYLKSVELNKEEFRKIKDYCDKKSILFLSTVSDKAGLELLMSIGVSGLKIGSTDTVNLPLLRIVGKTGLPVILSTGISNSSDVDISMKELIASGSEQIALLQCTSEYPANVEELNLRVIETFGRKYSCPVGFSDHSIGNYAAVAAVAVGAVIIEKHFTLDKTLPGVDHAASLMPSELCELVKAIRLVERALGSAEKTIQAHEKEHLTTMRKSLVANMDLAKGTKLAYENLNCKRPGLGISPLDIDKLVSKELKVDVSKDDLIQWGMVE